MSNTQPKRLMCASDPVAAIISRLDEVKQTGTDQWEAKCPAHEDNKASLSLRRGNDGRALLHCFAGCTVKCICAALKITEADLFLKGTGRQIKPRIVATYNYTDADGVLLSQVIRYDPKDFRQRAADGTWAVKGIAKPLYRLPAIIANDPSEPVFVVEGEKDVENLVRLGLCATCNAGGAEKWVDDDSALHSRQVVIIADKDDAGRRHANRVAAKLHGKAASIRIIEMPGHACKDVSDWISAGGTAETLMELVEQAAAFDPTQSSCHRNHNPEIPLDSEGYGDGNSGDEIATPLKPRERFPASLLPKPMAAMVEAVSKSTGTDPSMAGLAALVMAAGCIGNRAVVLLKEGYTEPAILWGGVVARSGACKSPVLKAIGRPLHDQMNRQRAQFEAAEKTHKMELAKFEATLAAWKYKQKSAVTSDPPIEPETPIEKRVIVADVTIEKLACLLKDNPMGLLSMRDELAVWLGDMDKYSNGKGDGANWLSLHDGAPVTVDRKTSGSIYVPHGAVSLIGGIQPGVLRRSFRGEERDSGMLARFLLVEPPERPARWIAQGVPHETSVAWGQMLETLLGMSPDCDVDKEVRPRVIAVPADVMSMYVDFFNRLSQRVNAEADDHLQSHLSKLRGICGRLSLILALCETAATGTETSGITVIAMANAIMLTDWFADEAERVYARLSDDEGEIDRQELIDLIRRRGGSLSPHDLKQASRMYKTSEHAEQALRDLQAHGYGDFTTQLGGAKGGRPKYLFTLSDAPSVLVTPKTQQNSDGFEDGDAVSDANERALP